MLKNKAVIFDMDGVLIDSEPFYLITNKHFLSSIGIDATDGEASKMVGASSTINAKRLLEEHPALSERYTQEELTSLHAKSITDSLFNAKDKIIPVKGIFDLIEKFRSSGFVLCIASSSTREMVNHVSKKYGFDALIENVVTGSDVKLGKPNPEIFLKAAALTGVSPDRCIVIEDSKNGVLAAKTAGMFCVGFSNPSSPTVQDLGGADIIIESYSEENFLKIITLFEGGENS